MPKGNFWVNMRETVCMISTGNAISSEWKDHLVREEQWFGASGVSVV